jgi:hypothetical protein
MGRPKAPEKRTSARERQIKRDLKLRERMRRDFLRPYDPTLRRETYRRPYERFITSKVIIHSTEDRTYPEAQKDPDPGKISGWFRAEPYDFYHGGLTGRGRSHFRLPPTRLAYRSPQQHWSARCYLSYSVRTE